METLRWAHENGCEWGVSACAGAAKGGQLKVLQWLRAKGCPWDDWTCYYAVDYGHVSVLRWARENGCPWHLGTQFGAARTFGYTDNLGNLVQGAPFNFENYVV